jgi:hypothetical protein
VVLVTWAGYPGVVCVTPVAWLLALRVGLLVARRSRAGTRRGRLGEAALAGAWFGLLQGVLFGVIAPWMGPLQAVILALAMLVIGMPVGRGWRGLRLSLWSKRSVK